MMPLKYGRSDGKKLSGMPYVPPVTRTLSETPTAEELLGWFQLIKGQFPASHVKVLAREKFIKNVHGIGYINMPEYLPSIKINHEVSQDQFIDWLQQIPSWGEFDVDCIAAIQVFTGIQ